MNNKLKGSLCMIASALAFAFMQVIIAYTSGEVPLFEQMLFRNLIASFIAFLALSKKGLAPFGHKENRPLLLLRSLAGFLGMITLFYATAETSSQGDVAILSKMSPFIVTVLAVIFLKEKISKALVLSLILSFTGAIIVSNPEFNTNVFPLFVAFLSAIFSGIAYTCVGALKGKEDPSVTIFFFSLVSTLGTIPFMLFDFVIPSFITFILLIMIGVTAAIGQLLLTYAYTFSSASEVSIYNYSGIIFSMILGFIFLGQSIRLTSILGACLVILSGFIVYMGNKSNT